MALKASLKVQLFADKVMVAESEDEDLWRRVLAAIQGAGTLNVGGDEDDEEVETPRRRAGKGVGGLAKDLGVSADALEGACEPSSEAPYIHLDPKCWEAFKKNTPQRGAKAVSAIQLAGTLLCLWFTHGRLDGRPTQAQAKEVLDGVGVTDKNPSRAVKNCTWLQSRGGGIQINPAELSNAQAVAKAFVTKQKIATAS